MSALEGKLVQPKKFNKTPMRVVIMKCRSCGTELEESWSFCPRCGVKKGEEFGRGLEDVMELFEKNIRGIFSGGFPMNFPFGKGFMVEISQEGGSPRVTVKELEEGQIKTEPPTEGAQEKARAVPKGAAVVEPVVSAVGEKTVVVQLPGVKSEEDIHIKKFHDSIEIRAFGEEKVYFAILPNIKSPNVEHKFENGVLTLKLT